MLKIYLNEKGEIGFFKKQITNDDGVFYDEELEGEVIILDTPTISYKNGFTSVDEATKYVEDCLRGKTEIETLKNKIEDTDYKIIKCMEYQLKGLNLPYDIDTLHIERQSYRDRINELEVKNGQS